jgi:hypothetical protein
LTRLLSELTGIQRRDEDKTKDGEDFSVYESLEPYKDVLTKKLAEVRKEILEHDIVYELSREEKKNKEDGDERKRETADK